MIDHIRRDFFGREVIIATSRGKRPNTHKTKVRGRKKREPCPFCAGNEKLTGETILGLPDKKRWKVRIFPNKFPVLKAKTFKSISRQPYQAFTARGRHEVLVECRDHNKEYDEMDVDNITLALKALKIRYEELMCMKDINYVTIFKNKGERAGATIKHTHTQIIASPLFPQAISKEMDEYEDFFKTEKKCGLCTVIAQEAERDDRVVVSNNSWICITPYASSWPYQISFIPKRHFSCLTDADDRELEDLARIMKSVFSAFSKIFRDLPYNMMYHNFPNSELWHFHMEVYPRLVTHAGFEFFGLNVNIKPPEEAAKELRDAME